MPYCPKVVMVMPTYNEALTITQTIHAIFAATAVLIDYDIYVLVFDSASTDATPAIVQNLQARYPKLLLKTEACKTGLGSAYCQAMHYALEALHADIVGEFDADLSHQPHYIAPMLDLLKTHDCVIGSRYVKGGAIPASWPLKRKMLSIIGNYTARMLLHCKYKDLTSGFRFTRKTLLKKVLPARFLSANYAYKLHLMWLLHQAKASIGEYPIQFVDRTAGFSKLPKHSIWDALWVMLRIRICAFKRYGSMCMVGLSGFVIQVLLYNSLRFIFSPKVALTYAVLAAIMHNFWWNNQVTFRYEATRLSVLQRSTMFVLYSLLALILQSSWLTLGLHIVGSGWLQENGLLFLGVLLLSGFNYFIYSRLIWAK
ncbi:MAG TPA: glycosyltransferase family 2 protein [Legionellales bacterium]|nr:glycosyltransferase family 2 protein [Legionellales bacterium]